MRTFYSKIPQLLHGSPKKKNEREVEIDQERSPSTIPQNKQQPQQRQHLAAGIIDMADSLDLVSNRCYEDTLKQTRDRRTNNAPLSYSKSIQFLGNPQPQIPAQTQQNSKSRLAEQIIRGSATSSSLFHPQSFLQQPRVQHYMPLNPVQRYHAEGDHSAVEQSNSQIAIPQKLQASQSGRQVTIAQRKRSHQANYLVNEETNIVDSRVQNMLLKSDIFSTSAAIPTIATSQEKGGNSTSIFNNQTIVRSTLEADNQQASIPQGGTPIINVSTLNLPDDKPPQVQNGLLPSILPPVMTRAPKSTLMALQERFPLKANTKEYALLSNLEQKEIPQIPRINQAKKITPLFAKMPYVEKSKLYSMGLLSSSNPANPMFSSLKQDSIITNESDTLLLNSTQQQSLGQYLNNIRSVSNHHDVLHSNDQLRHEWQSRIARPSRGTHSPSKMNLLPIDSIIRKKQQSQQLNKSGQINHSRISNHMNTTSMGVPAVPAAKKSISQSSINNAEENKGKLEFEESKGNVISSIQYEKQTEVQGVSEAIFKESNQAGEEKGVQSTDSLEKGGANRIDQGLEFKGESSQIEIDDKIQPVFEMNQSMNEAHNSQKFQQNSNEGRNGVEKRSIQMQYNHFHRSNLLRNDEEYLRQQQIKCGLSEQSGFLGRITSESEFIVQNQLPGSKLHAKKVLCAQVSGNRSVMNQTIAANIPTTTRASTTMISPLPSRKVPVTAVVSSSTTANVPVNMSKEPSNSIRKNQSQQEQNPTKEIYCTVPDRGNFFKSKNIVVNNVLGDSRNTLRLPQQNQLYNMTSSSRFESGAIRPYLS